MRKLVYVAIFALVASITSNAFAQKQLKVGLVFDKGGRDDKSFNASAYRGALDAKKKFPILLKTVVASDDAAIEPALRTFAQRKFDLIVGVGFLMGQAIEKVAKAFPKQHFLLIDMKVDAPNVRSISFKEHEGSYVIGVIAALSTQTNAVGFIGGMDIPLIRRFSTAFEAGVQSINPRIKVHINYIGSTSEAWRNPTKAKELALLQYKRKADIIFVGAGASALGAFDAAEEKKKFIIGVDSNQNWIKPGRVLTSMLKRVDLAVFKTIEQKVKGKFQSGISEWGLKEGGVDFAIDKYNQKILKPSVIQKANAVKEAIQKNEINVPDYYKIFKKLKNTKISLNQ